MLTRLAFAAMALVAAQIVPGTASACLMHPVGQIAIIDAELPKAKLKRTKIAEVNRLRAQAMELMAANKQYEASRVAQRALAILKYNPPGPPTRC